MYIAHYYQKVCNVFMHSDSCHAQKTEQNTKVTLAAICIAVLLQSVVLTVMYTFNPAVK